MEPEGSLPHSQVPANCPYPEPTQSSPKTSFHFLKIHLNIILPFPLGLPSGLFPSGFPTKILYTPLFSPIRATCPANLILLDFIIRRILGEDYRSLGSSLCSFLHSLVTSSFLDPNILLNTLFSNTLSLCSFHNVRDQVSHPHKTTNKITVLYISIFKSLDSKLEDKRFCTEWQQAFPDFNLLLISTWIEFWSVKGFPKYLNSCTP